MLEKVGSKVRVTAEYPFPTQMAWQKIQYFTPLEHQPKVGDIVTVTIGE